MSRIIASIEARMSSSRLPGKVLADIGGQPALTRLLRRLRQAQSLNGIILATSTNPADDPLEQWGAEQNLPVYRGSEEDVLARVVGAQRQMNSDIVVEITGDSILLDPEIIDWGVTTFLENECDVVANVKKLSFPMGIDVQVYRLSDLEEISKTITDSAVREHVSLYFYEHPERYRIFHLFAPSPWHAPDYRFQLDYPEDLHFIREIYRLLEPQYGDRFGVGKIISLLHKNPSLLDINRQCIEKPAREREKST
ncbi:MULTISPECIES: glycosyltransferase family protein [Spirulina sp. CCY15215]|uniref:cytidylyltransferase domain-containing protein n=1 Tax=Spirulina sp. CCY15215 TaxID=2767591 RepID=UPI0019503830